MRKQILVLTILVLSIFMFGGLVRAPPPPALPHASQSTTATVTVNEFISLTLLNVPIDFGTMNPGEVNKEDTNPLTARIGAETNVNVNIYTKANDTLFKSETNSFPIGNMQWAITSGFVSPHDYTTVDNLVITGTAGHDYLIYHRIHIPLAQQQGFYSVGITITATGS